MIKKAIIALCICTTIFIFQTATQADEIGIGDIIFEENAMATTKATTHNFFINELSYTLTKEHLEIAGRNPDKIYYQSETLATIKELETLTKTDIIELLDMASDKEQALHNYIIACEHALQKGGAISAYIQQETQLLKSDMEDCLTDKKISNQAYFDAIDTYDQKTMEKSISETITYENCATENRIQYNAKTGVARKLVFYLGLLQKKYDVLFNKQEILAKNFEIFRDNILPDLNEIDTLFKQYTF